MSTCWFSQCSYIVTRDKRCHKKLGNFERHCACARRLAIHALRAFAKSHFCCGWHPIFRFVCPSLERKLYWWPANSPYNMHKWFVQSIHNTNLQGGMLVIELHWSWMQLDAKSWVCSLVFPVGRSWGSSWEFGGNHGSFQWARQTFGGTFCQPPQITPRSTPGRWTCPKKAFCRSGERSSSSFDHSYSF